MLESYKKRGINDSQEVEVYRNLHNDLFSIRQKGLVVAHGEGFIITDVTPIVSEAGRQRVIKEKAKNVHAVLRGRNVIDAGFLIGKHIAKPNEVYDELYYNPYKTEGFINKRTSELVEHVNSVLLFNGKAYIVKK